MGRVSGAGASAEKAAGNVEASDVSTQHSGLKSDDEFGVTHLGGDTKGGEYSSRAMAA